MGSSTIRYSRIVDLSHPLLPSMLIWPGDPPMAINPHSKKDRDGYYLNAIAIGEHTGTHIGAPAHFQTGGATVDHLPVEALVRSAVVFNVIQSVRTDHDFRLRAIDIVAWEEKHGRIPSQCVAILYTGWQDRWPDSVTFFNADATGQFHFPGFSIEAAQLLINERNVAGLGTDTHSIDSGTDADYSINRITLGRNRFHLENLTNLDELPAQGSILVIGALKIVGGSGSPARVLAFVP